MRLSQIHHLVLPQLKKALNWNRMGREIYFHCRKLSLKRCVSKPCSKYGIFIHTSWLSRIKSPLRSRIFVPHYKKKKKKKTYLSSFDHKLRITKLFSVLLVDKLVNLELIRWLAWILYLSFICLIYLPIFFLFGIIVMQDLAFTAWKCFSSFCELSSSCDCCSGCSSHSFRYYDCYCYYYYYYYYYYYRHYYHYYGDSITD